MKMGGWWLKWVSFFGGGVKTVGGGGILGCPPWRGTKEQKVYLKTITDFKIFIIFQVK